MSDTEVADRKRGSNRAHGATHPAIVQVADRQFKARHVEIHGLAGYGPSQLVSRKGGVASEGLSIANERDQFGLQKPVEPSPPPEERSRISCLNLRSESENLVNGDVAKRTFR